MSPPFFDTNIVLYAFTDAGDKTQTAERILLQGGVVSVHVLNELTSVSRSRFKMNWEEVGTLVRDTITMCPEPQALTYESYVEAVRISKRYGFSIWDGAILACALVAG